MKYPWMPLFWGDFLANTMHLSAQEAGAYLFLIAHAWEHEGTIPAERTRLACIAHVRESHWARVWKGLEPFFEPLSVGVVITGYSHQRVRDELLRLGKISSKRKAAAEQMLSKSRANAEQTTPLSTSTSTSNRDAFNGKGSEAPSMQMQGAPSPAPPPQKQYLGMSPDQGNAYRSPPVAKSDNVLEPIPERLPHEGIKRP
jgi:uncharacterized protein YdaU (DUF1376 family)